MRWFSVIIMTLSGRRATIDIAAEDEYDAEDRAQRRFPGCEIVGVEE